MISDFKYDDNDIISDVIINFYESSNDKEKLKEFIDLYTGCNNFYNFVQKNFLINKISDDYLLKFINDFDDFSDFDDYDVVTCFNTTKWI